MIRPYGIDTTVLVANHVKALLAIGEWEEADKVSAAALRTTTANHPHIPLILRADLEIGRGDFDGSRAHLEAARPTLRHGPGLAIYSGSVAELALWERRWTDADQAVQDGLEWAHFREAAQIGVLLCAKGLRAQAELAALARASRDTDAVRKWLAGTQKLIAAASPRGCWPTTAMSTTQTSSRRSASWRPACPTRCWTASFSVMSRGRSREPRSGGSGK